MTDETIIAVYNTPKMADAAIHDLKVHGVPPNAISLHAKLDPTGELDAGVPAPPEQHFFIRMLGYEPTPQAERMELIYDGQLQNGSRVVSVHGSAPPNVDITAILDRHHPLVLERRS